MANDQRKARTREKIVTAAMRSFAAQGFASTPARTIAEEAGVAFGTVFWHFETKSRLYREVLQHAGARVVEDMREHVECESATLPDLLKSWADLLSGNAEVRGLLVSVGADLRHLGLNGDPQLPLVKTLIDFWRAALTRLELTGRVPPLERKDDFAQLIVAATCGLLATGGKGPSREMLELLADVGSPMEAAPSW